MPLKTHQDELPTLNLTPMIDVVFLLIIFFILNSTFVTEANIKLSPPASANVEKMEKAVISVTMDEQGILRHQGQETSVTGLQNLIESQLGENKQRILQVRIDEKLTTAQYMPVMEAISAAGATMNMIGQRNIDDGQ